jgi:hypothetical protein
MQKADIPFYTYTADNFIQQEQEHLQLQIQKETIEEVRESRLQDVKQPETLKPPLPSPDVFPGSDLYPALAMVWDVERHREAVNQMVNSLGGGAEFGRQIQQQQQALRQRQQFLPSSIAPRHNSENLENSQISDEDELDQDQRDHSSSAPANVIALVQKYLILYARQRGLNGAKLFLFWLDVIYYERRAPLLQAFCKTISTERVKLSRGSAERPTGGSYNKILPI